MIESLYRQKRPSTIAVVDYDRTFVKTLKSSLTRDGYHVITFHNPIDAWEYLSSGYMMADMLILNQCMPELDGMELLKKMKQEPKTENIPVIMQLSVKGTEHETIAAGASFFLRKPYKMRYLQKIVSYLEDGIKERNRLIAEYERSTHAFQKIQSVHFQLHRQNDIDGVTSMIASLGKDSERVSKAIEELLSNAVKHGALSEGGQPVDVYLVKNDHHVKIVVRDYGPGFNWHPYIEDNLSHLFDMLGRGITYARCMGIENLTYNGKGNEARFSFPVL